MTVRGRTTLGQAGYCISCRRHVPDGPDACLGTLSGVAHACCGHGITEPYVVFGDYPNQPAYEIDGLAEARGAAATAYFKTAGRAAP